MTTRGTAVTALQTSLSSVLTGGYVLTRATGTPEIIPSGLALVTVHDGSCEAAEPLLSPMRYEVIWASAVTVDAATDAALDAAVALIAARLIADPTLSGAVDWAEMGMPETEVVSNPALDGMGQQPPIFAATLPVRLHYVADSPAG